MSLSDFIGEQSLSNLPLTSFCVTPGSCQSWYILAIDFTPVCQRDGDWVKETLHKAFNWNTFCHTDLDFFVDSKCLGFEQLQEKGKVCMKNSIFATPEHRSCLILFCVWLSCCKWCEKRPGARCWHALVYAGCLTVPLKQSWRMWNLQTPRSSPLWMWVSVSALLVLSVGQLIHHRSA